ncbi:MAG TPA: peptidylprolyl isomerase [Mucilaginibacter sp.]
MVLANIILKNFKLIITGILYLAVTNTFAQQKEQFVKIETGQGSCIIKLYNETPVHRDNFIRLAKSHYFDATTFNRILKGFVIQGGDPDSLYDKSKTLKPEQKWIGPEFNTALYHKRGAVAMGRDDNAAKQSFTTQFYIVDGRTYTDAQLDAIEKKHGTVISPAQRQVYRTIGGTPSLDQNYTVFGEIVKGMDLIDKLVAEKVNKAGNPDAVVWMKVTALTPTEAARELK